MSEFSAFLKSHFTESETLNEVKKKLVVRGGKKVKIGVKKPGYKIVDGKYVKMSGQEKLIKKKAGKKAAKKRKAKQASISRKQKRSTDKRTSNM